MVLKSIAPYPMYVNNPQYDPQSTDPVAKDLTVPADQLFAQLRSVLIQSLPEGPEKSDSLARLDALETAKGYTFVRHYSRFVEGVATHMDIVSPYIPGLTSILVRV